MRRYSFNQVAAGVAVLAFLVLAALGRAQAAPFAIAFVGSAVAEAMANLLAARGSKLTWLTACLAVGVIAVWGTSFLFAMRLERVEDLPGPVNLVLGLWAGKCVGDLVAAPKASPGTETQA